MNTWANIATSSFVGVSSTANYYIKLSLFSNLHNWIVVDSWLYHNHLHVADVLEYLMLSSLLMG